MTLDTGFDEAPEQPGTGSDRVTSDLVAIAKLAQQSLSDPVRIKVRAMPGFSVEYRTDIEADDLDRIFKRARKRVNGNWVSDQVSAFRQILAETCEGIYKDGKPQTNSDGDITTFRDPELNAAFGFDPPDTVALVGAFFKNRDGEINGHCDRVLKAAGFGDDVEDDDASDPTNGD